MQYNQDPKSGQVRIGNWQEELILEKETGIRFYPNPTDRDKQLLTGARVISSYADAKSDYNTVTNTTLGIPQSHPEYRGAESKVGPRARLLEEKLRKEVEKEYAAKSDAVAAETKREQFVTENQQKYFTKTTTTGLREHDPTVRLPGRWASYSVDAAVTYYSHAVAKNKKLNFPATFVGSQNPFMKSSAFSADIQYDVLINRTENNERPNPLPTLIEYQYMNQFRSRLLDAAKTSMGPGAYAKGSAIRAVIECIWSNSDQILLPFQEFAQRIAAMHPEFQISEKERQALLYAYDAKSDGVLDLRGVTELIRRTPNQRRFEVIDHFYTKLDSSGSAVIVYRELMKPLVKREMQTNPGLKAFVEALNIAQNSEDAVLAGDDFYDYYTDISSEIEDDYEFEMLLRDTWKSL